MSQVVNNIKRTFITMSKRRGKDTVRTASTSAKKSKTSEVKAGEGGDVKSNGDVTEYKFWLMKSEPDTRLENGIDVKFGIEDLKMEPEQTACWDGVRNYQARNFMRAMKKGQKAFFYHSNTKPPGIAGLVEIVKENYVDHTQFDKKDPHYDSKASKDNPRWFMVDVQYLRMTSRYIPLHELKALHLEHKATGGPLKDFALFTRARLSVMPVREEEWDFIMSLEKEEKENDT